MNSHWELLLDFVVEGLPVRKFRSKKTGLVVCLAGVEGPLVNGFFTLATEAHDDDGLPHTLEHLVFMGSERYPYKGVLDLFANRCLAQGTNAWTDTDHTCYTVNTAGSEGFLNLLPIYLDHVLYPTLTDSAFLTEVHHVNESGEDAGVVYCEMQGRENTGPSLTYLNLLRDLYPGHCGCKSETGGVMANLRDSCSNEKVRGYHRSFYRPDNLCLIITGQVDAPDVFKALADFEEKIVAKGNLPAMERPWSSPIPPLSQSHERILQFPTDDTSTGLVKFGWRGPKSSDHVGTSAVKVVWEYLTDTSVAPLQKALVETDDPYCSDVKPSQIEFPEGCLVLTLKNVPFAKLRPVKEKVEAILKGISSGEEPFDMSRMEAVIHRQILDTLGKMEDHGHDAFTFIAIGDFLYSSSEEELKVRTNVVERLESLKKEPSDYWTKLLNQYFVSAPSVVVIGEPSSDLSEKMQKDEKLRVGAQRERLGEAGLKRKGDELAEAIKENEIEPPDDLVVSVDVPRIDSIRFHPLETTTNRVDAGNAAMEPLEGFSLERMPFQFRLDDIHTSFVQVSALLDTTPVPESLKAYLPLFIELLCESPLIRNGVLVPHEQVIAELAADTLLSETSFGVSGYRFAPGSFPQLIALKLKFEMKKYEKGVRWVQELLYQTQFTVERAKIVATKMLNEISSAKRSGIRVARALSSRLNFEPKSILQISSFLTQQDFLSNLMKTLEEKPEEVVTSLDRVCSCLADPSKVRVHMATDVKKLPKNAHELWKNFFNTLNFTSPGVLVCPPEVAYSSKLHRPSDSSPTGCIAGVGSVESSFLIQTSPSMTTYDHPDLPAVMVFMEYLCALEGPLWRQVRGMGLAYHYNMYANVEHGLLYFVLFKCTHVVKAYEESKKIVNDFLSGESEFDSVQLESAKSSVIFEIIEREKSVFDAAKQSLLSEFRNVDHDYNRTLLERVASVSVDDLRRVGETYVRALFDPSKSKCAICCNPSKVDEVREAFERDLQVVKFN